MKIIPIFILLFSCIFYAHELEAQSPELTVTISQDTVYAGDRFAITYLVNGSLIADVQLPELEAFNLLSGPNIRSSTTVINGVVSKKMSQTYFMRAVQVGDQTIEPATVILGDKEIMSETLIIHVLENPNGEVIEKNSFDNVKPKKSSRKTFKI